MIGLLIIHLTVRCTSWEYASIVKLIEVHIIYKDLYFFKILDMLCILGSTYEIRHWNLYVFQETCDIWQRHFECLLAKHSTFALWMYSNKTSDICILIVCSTTFQHSTCKPLFCKKSSRIRCVWQSVWEHVTLYCWLFLLANDTHSWDFQLSSEHVAICKA